MEARYSGENVVIDAYHDDSSSRGQADQLCRDEGGCMRVHCTRCSSK